MIYLLLVSTGILVGLISSFFGVGGGILAVPALYMIFPMIPPQVVIASSLAMIYVNSIINTFNFLRDGRKPRKELFLPIGIGIIFGVIVGSYLTDILLPNTIKLIFGIALVLAAIKTLFVDTKNLDDFANIKNSFFIQIIAGTSSFVGGIISGLTGLGGGIILVPLFITLLKIPFKWIPVYSNIGMALGTFAGIIFYSIKTTPSEIFQNDILNQLQSGYVNWGIVFFLFAGASISSKFGVSWSRKISHNKAKYLFFALLVIASVKILTSVKL